jgi:phosphoglycolate phosphatase-like HAD superfamily hydrolase
LGGFDTENNDDTPVLTLISLFISLLRSLNPGVFKMMEHTDHNYYRTAGERRLPIGHTHSIFSVSAILLVLYAGKHQIRMFEGAREGIARLESAGFLLAVATGKGRRGLDEELATHQLDRFFAASRCNSHHHLITTR